MLRQAIADHRVAKSIHHRPVVPQRAVFASLEAVKHRIPEFAEIRKNRTYIVQLIRRRNQGYFRVCLLADVTNVSLFALQPWRFGFDFRIGTSFDDVRHSLSVLRSNALQRGESTLIFDGIMQQGGNRHFFIAARLDHQRSHTEQMRDVRDIVPTLLHLTSMQFGGEIHRPTKARTQRISSGFAHARSSLP